VILSDGGVKCWGNNGFGQLGLGDTNHRGDQPNEMGDNLPEVNLGTGKAAVAVFPGTWHTCALLNDNSVKCWGNNNNGNLGLGDIAFRGDGPNEMGDSLPPVNLGTGKTAVTLSSGMNTCAILNDGSLKCWGWNAFGQLGLGDTNDRGDALNEIGDSLPAVDLGTGKTAIAIRVDETLSCALLNDGSVKCWGWNDFGSLGQGDTTHRGDQPNEMGDNLPAIDLGATAAASAIEVGGPVCALLSGGRLKCWGTNHVGGLGLGDTNHRGDNPGEMGDNLPFIAP
jgi:alpha-tubulin suppressor-like RCC1 family protein